MSPRRKPPTSGQELTPREIELVELLAAGFNTREVAASMGIEVATVRSFLKSVFTKLDVSSRAQAIVRAHKLGIITID